MITAGAQWYDISWVVQICQALTAPPSRTTCLHVSKISHKLLPLTLSVHSADPVRDLNDFLQKPPERRPNAKFSWALSQEGPNHQVTHYATAKCEVFSYVTNLVRWATLVRGAEIGRGRGAAIGTAKKEAAMQALAYLKASTVEVLIMHGQWHGLYSMHYEIYAVEKCHIFVT